MSVKVLAVYHASFTQLLWLDADSVPARDPSWVFASGEFTRTGSIFWQDWSTDPHWLSAEFMHAYGLEMRVGDRELEAGQFALDKIRCWVPLNVALYLNLNFRHFYRRMYGDKDTWRLAFRLSRHPLGLAPHPADVLGSLEPLEPLRRLEPLDAARPEAGSSLRGGPVRGGGGRFCGSAMLHLDEDGAPAFIHRTLQTLPSSPTPGPWEAGGPASGVQDATHAADDAHDAHDAPAPPPAGDGASPPEGPG
ncbi:mannosyltransferase putative-domain-containing protein, partial [Baffinella frigidus]